MNFDTLKKIIFGLLVFFAIVSLSVGKLIFGAMGFLAAVVMYLVAGKGGSYNDRNIYNKQVPQSPHLTMDAVADALVGLDTPFGTGWIAGHRQFEGKVLVFGPSEYKDYILVAQSKGRIELSCRTDIKELNVPEAEQYRVERVLKTEHLEVTPSRFSEFVAYKEAATLLLTELTDALTQLAQGQPVTTPIHPAFTTFHYHSGDSIVWDMDSNQYARTSAQFRPLSVVIYDMDGRTQATVTGDSNREKEGFAVTVEGAPYGTIRRDTSSRSDEFVLQTPEGEYRIQSFPAVRRANVTSNYRVTLDGDLKAILAGSRKIDFQSLERTVENDVIVSYDDENLLMYLALQEFIMTHNRFAG